MGKLTPILTFVQNDTHLTQAEFTSLDSIIAQFDAFETWLYFWATFPVLQSPGDPPLPPPEIRISLLFGDPGTDKSGFISCIDSVCIGSSYDLNAPVEYANLLIAAGDFYDMFNKPLNQQINIE